MIGVFRGSQQLQGDGESGIADPLRTVHCVSKLIEFGRDLGYTFNLSTDFKELAAVKKALRDTEISPMFDLAVDSHLSEIAFWIKATSEQGEICGLQAYRLDFASPNLAEWVLGWMMGLYARRREMIIPRQALPPDNSLTSLIRGKVVYSGEVWVSRNAKKGLSEAFARLGVLLAFIKWNPDAIWALTSTSMATRGFMLRAGLGYIEPSFLTWLWSPAGASDEEWISVAPRRHLEFLVSEMSAKEAKYPPAHTP